MKTLLWLFAFSLALGAFGQEPKLSIEHATLHTSEDGAPASSDYDFVPGDTVYFSCQLAGYKKSQKEYDKYEIYLTFWASRASTEYVR